MDSARNIFAGLPPASECLVILLGCAKVTVFGLAGLANPTEFANAYGIPLLPSSTSQKDAGRGQSSPEGDSKDEKLRKTQTAFISAIAARNVQHGILLLSFACYTRDRRALGIATALNAVTTLADALIARTYGVQGAVFGHVVGVANSLAVGGALLYWQRGDAWW